MLKRNWLFLAGGAAMTIAAGFAVAADMAESNDHPDLPRIEGTHIVGYSRSTYDEGEFVIGMENRQLQTVKAEGERTRIVYFGQKEMSPLLLLRNYERAFADLGEVEEVFSCRKETCYTNFPSIFIWHKNNRVPNDIPGAQWVYGNTSYYQDQLYWYGTVTASDAKYHIALYATVFSDANQVEEVRGIPVAHIEIIELTDFEPTLAVVTAAEMTSAIEEQGHIALYGVHFDLDSADLRAESQPTLREIAAALSSDPGLRLYVVGHTDNQGTLEYNQDLSQRRAAAVVKSLAEEHGIAIERLIPLGAGLMAPIASNDTEDGRALNRRVELVKI